MRYPLRSPIKLWDNPANTSTFKSGGGTDLVKRFLLVLVLIVWCNSLHPIQDTEKIPNSKTMDVFWPDVHSSRNLLMPVGTEHTTCDGTEHILAQQVNWELTIISDDNFTHAVQLRVERYDPKLPEGTVAVVDVTLDPMGRSTVTKVRNVANVPGLFESIAFSLRLENLYVPYSAAFIMITTHGNEDIRYLCMLMEQSAPEPDTPSA